MSVPSIRLVAYESRNPAMIFVAVPNEVGRYVRTDRSVALVACPQCKAVAGEPCKSRGTRYTGGTHYARRIVARQISGKPHAPDVEKNEVPDEPLEFPQLEFPPLDDH